MKEGSNIIRLSHVRYINLKYKHAHTNSSHSIIIPSYFIIIIK